MGHKVHTPFIQLYILNVTPVPLYFMTNLCGVKVEGYPILPLPIP